MSMQQPMNLEAEQATLGAVLLNRDALLAIRSWLEPAHFWLPKHGAIYGAMTALLDRGVPPDTRTVADELSRRGALTDVGGVLYLAQLTDTTPSSYHVEHYAREVWRCAVLRGVMAAGARIATIGARPGADADEAVAEALTVVNGLVQQQADEAVEHISLTVETVVGQMQSDERPYIATGYPDLDVYLGGLWPDDLLTLAARPSVGKTAFALSLTHSLALRDVPVLFFSLEMGREQLVQRLAAMTCGLDLHRLRHRIVRPDEAPRFAAAMRTLSARPIFTCDLAGLTLAGMRARLMRHLNDYPQTVVILDYLQLMAGDKRSENRVQEVSAITRGLKRLAMDAHTPIIALSQLSRAVEGRTSHIPMLSDLRESGSIEQDSDIVMFLYREELYEPDTDKKGTAELHIAKHRNGPLGVVSLRFDAATTHFQPLTFRRPEGY